MAERSLSMAEASTKTIKLRIDRLMPHEDVSKKKVESLKRRMRKDGVQKREIVVARIGDRFLIIDGHHRAAAVAELGCKSIIAREIGFYLSDHVEVWSWRSGGSYQQVNVIQRALAGDLYPPQSTKHVCREDGSWHRFRHSKLEKKVNYKLKKLMRVERIPAPPMLLI